MSDIPMLKFSLLRHRYSPAYTTLASYEIKISPERRSRENL
jgi:hypothetical protein